MIIYLVRRIVAGLSVFITVTFLCFLLYSVQGADAIARKLLGRPDVTIEEVQAKADQLGLDRPVIVQYGDWLGGVFTGTMGQSFVSGQDVTAMLATRVPVTLSLIITSLLLTVVFAVVLGVLAATRGGIIDRSLQGASVLVGAVPSYLLALGMVILFAVNLRLVPATGYISLQKSFLGWLSTVTLPAIAIALQPILGLAVWVRSAIIDMSRKEWVRTLTARGIPQRTIMYRHVLRNAAASTVQLIGLMVIGLANGSIIVERIFALQGVGLMAISAGQVGDIPAMLGTVTVLLVVILIINIVVDIVNGLLNPKARIS